MPKTIAQRVSALEKFVIRLLSAATHPGKGQAKPRKKTKRPKAKRAVSKARRKVAV
jgi:hypothetical protein